MKFKCVVEMDNLTHDDELVEILREMLNQILIGNTGKRVVNSKGAFVGQWAFENDTYEQD